MGADHVAWALACTDPIARGDGPRHALIAVQHALAQQERPLPLALRPLLATNYYPAFVAWLALPVMNLLGPTGHLFRALIGVYSGLLVGGSGALAWRCWGRSAALPAALMAATVPLLWSLRGEVMLDAPLAAMGAWFLVVLPAAGPARRGQALGCGLLLGAGMLTKQAMPYVALPALAVVGARASFAAVPGWGGRAALATLVGGVGLGAVALYVARWPWAAVAVMAVLGLSLAVWGHRGRAVVGRAWLRDLAVLGLVALAVAGPWYARSAEPILTGLELARIEHPGVPQGWPGVVRILGMVEYLTHHLLPAPVAVAGLLGVGVAVPLGRGRPWVLPTMVTGLAAFALISRFPDLHGRHYAPLVPILVACAAAGFAALARGGWWGRWGSGALTVALGIWVGALAVSWRAPFDLEPARLIDQRDADISPALPAPNLPDLARRLMRPPTLFRLQAPSPTATDVPLHAAIAAAEADRAARWPDAVGHVLVGDVTLEVPGVHLALVEGGFTRLHPVSPATVGHARKQLEREPVYLLELLSVDGQGRAHRRAADPSMVALGATELQRWPARHVESAADLALVLLRADPR